MIKRIAHIAIAVRDLEAASKFFEEKLGLRRHAVEVLEEEKVKIAFFPVGDSEVELIEGIGPDNPVAKFLEKRGEGIHHIALEVENLQGQLDLLASAAVPLLDRSPRDGGQGTNVAFLHPKGTHGVLIELVEVLPSRESLNPEP
ncbi:MAG: methylmalonyl-CoA epimerase [candidate division NC10 bacterium]|nr:methylmalonyl-CoA epimerase [candidate division NC10 bacterium]